MYLKKKGKKESKVVNLEMLPDTNRIQWWLQENETENGGEVNGGADDLVENDNEAYVHEAFMADWRPETSNIVASGKGNPSGHILPQVGSFVKQQPNGYMHGRSRFSFFLFTFLLD